MDTAFNLYPGHLENPSFWGQKKCSDCALVKLVAPGTGFANFIDEWSQCDFCFTNFGVILKYLESGITTKKAIFRLSGTWSWHVYTIVRDTRTSCDGPLTWKAQIHDGGH